MTSTSQLTLPKWLAWVAGAWAILLAAIFLGLSFGSSGFGGFDTIVNWLLGQVTEQEANIITQARLPRVLMAMAVGCALGTGGAVFQSVLRNPLADPYILGISGGAALGGSLALTLSVATVGVFVGSVQLGAFAGAMVALAAMVAVAKWVPGGRMSTYVLLLAGVIFNAFASAVIMFLKAVVTAQKAQELLFYLMGTLAIEGVSWVESLVVLVLISTVTGIVWMFAKDLNVSTLGDEAAMTLGVDVPKVRRTTVVLTSLAVALAVAYTGLIGFVGLVVPHGVRLVAGPDHRLLIPLCALFGAAFVVLSDVVARASFIMTATTLPVGVVTAFVGAPLFAYFLARHLRGHRD